MKKRDLVQAFTALTDVNMIDDESRSLESLVCPDSFNWLVAPIAVAQNKEPVVQNGEPAGDVDAVIDKALQNLRAVACS